MRAEYLVLVLSGAAILAALFLGFRARRNWIRISLGIGIALIFLPILILLTVGVTWGLNWKEPPTLAELARDFPACRGALEKLLEMSNEDSQFSRISPNLVMLNFAPGSSFRRDVTADRSDGLPKDRFAAYQEAFQQSGLKLGLDHDKVRDTFFMVDSVGLMNRGHVSGYVRCAVDATPGDVDRFAPCLSNQDSGARQHDPQSRVTAYSFKMVASGWYVYDEGPS